MICLTLCTEKMSLFLLELLNVFAAANVETYLQEASFFFLHCLIQVSDSNTGINIKKRFTFHILILINNLHLLSLK